MEESDSAQGMTRTGRIYTPEHLGGSSNEAATKQPVIETRLDDLWRKISILSLLPNSEAHKNDLMKVLSDAYVPNNVTYREMANMMGKVLEIQKITFHEDELPPEGLSHNWALHITVQFEDTFITRVLKDRVSSLNICPLTTLKRLGKGFYEIRAGSMNVKSFDGSQRATIGEINLCMYMGPTWFHVEFQVLDISASYNLLLGQPWIHAARAEVIIHVDGSNPIYTSQTIPVIENRRRLGGETYHHIEHVNAVEKDKWWSNIIESILAWYGYETGKDLGKNLQGITKLIQLKCHGTTFGLGYQYTWQEYDDWLPLWHGPYYPLEQPLPHMGQTFQQADTIWATAEEEALAGMRNLFLEDENMDCSAIIEEEEEEECLTIQTVEKRAILRNWTVTPSRACRVLGVPAGKLLGFIVSRRGIKEPSNVKKAFDKIKEYLSTPPVLVLPEPGRPLLLYLSVLDGAFGCVLGKHDETGRKEQDIYYLREDITEAYDCWRMFFDGAANFKEVGIGAVLLSEIGQHYPVSVKLWFPCTNNMVEYVACIMGLNLAINMNIQELMVIGESDLLVYQVQGEWAMKNTKILPYVYHMQELMKEFTKIEFKHVPKIQNEFANALTTLSSMIQHPDKNFIDPVPVRIHNRPAYCAHMEEEKDGKPYFHDIKEYLARGEYPEQANHTQKSTLRRISNHFFQRGGTLYRRTPDLGLLRCVDAKEASKLLE
ncbi:uncharacterized protein [Nicotiana sylvestris]|uniref:uncharacterized protein n=1 Tax=Nicotiana sylvestris TaxID=4096 RepID=UPI00388CA2D0